MFGVTEAANKNVLQVIGSVAARKLKMDDIR